MQNKMNFQPIKIFQNGPITNKKIYVLKDGVFDGAVTLQIAEHDISKLYRDL